MKVNRGNIFSWSIDGCLILLAFVGGIYSIKSSRERFELEYHLNQSSDKSDALRVESVDRIHVRAIATGKPLEFAWRVYLPAGFKLLPTMNFEGSTTSKTRAVPLPEANESVLRIKFRRFGGEGSCECRWLGELYALQNGLDEFSPNEWTVTQTAADAMQTFPVDQNLDFLRIEGPNSNARPKTIFHFGLRTKRP